MGLVIALIIWWKVSDGWRITLFILIGFVAGLTYYRIFDNHERLISLPYNQEVILEGQVIGHPDFLATSSRYTISYEKTKIQVVAPRFPEYHYGDIIKIKGALKSPSDYQFHQGILGVVYNPEILEKKGVSGNVLIKVVYLVRDKFETVLNKIWSEPYASFAAGLVLGSRRSIPDSLLSDFNRTGTTHIVAVSGYNVTIIIVNLGIILGLLSRKLKFWGSLVAILGFVVLTGAPASVVRAGLLAGLVAWGQFEGRRVNLTILMLVVAFLMLLFNPYALKYDISFQLSFLAFAGLVYLSTPIANLKLVRFFPKTFKNIFSETMAAQLMVLPILIYYFGRVSIISPLANILILWLIPSSMGLVLVVGMIGLLWLNLGHIVGFISWLLLKYIIIVIEGLSKIPWASYELKTNSWWWMVIFYCLVGFAVFKFKLKEKYAEKS